MFDEEQKIILNIALKESLVLTSLKNSKSIFTLSKDIKIPRATLYPIIQNLYRRGFIQHQKHGNRFKYQTSSPEILSGIFEKIFLNLKEEIKLVPKVTPPPLKTETIVKPKKLTRWLRSIFK